MERDRRMKKEKRRKPEHSPFILYNPIIAVSFPPITLFGSTQGFFKYLLRFLMYIGLYIHIYFWRARMVEFA
jgi:hypothetical protein